MPRYDAMRRILPTVYALILLIPCSAIDAFSQSVPLIDGPPAPIAPEVITRDASGKATVRAIKLTAPLRVDGTLDEAVYTQESRSAISCRWPRSTAP